MSRAALVRAGWGALLAASLAGTAVIWQHESHDTYRPSELSPQAQLRFGEWQPMGPPDGLNPMRVTGVERVEGLTPLEEWGPPADPIPDGSVYALVRFECRCPDGATGPVLRLVDDRDRFWEPTSRVGDWKEFGSSAPAFKIGRGEGVKDGVQHLVETFVVPKDASGLSVSVQKVKVGDREVMGRVRP
ncbi:MAG: hypothetical protein LWW86_05380 [Micrococcales bacterium]|nr:hypothetical protein [Micrococcales bacterium]